METLSEIWKDIPGYEGYYQVSNLGRIKSLSRIVFHPKGNLTIKSRLLRYTTGSHGYFTTTLYKDSKANVVLVHRILAMSFIPNINNKKCVNHIDGNKKNLSLSNLEWVSHAENNKHALSIGLKKTSWEGKRGNKHHRSKPVLQYSKNGILIAEHESMALAAEAINKDHGGISRACSGKNYTAFGYKWKYKI